jgi:hypothetical protein
VNIRRSTIRQRINRVRRRRIFDFERYNPQMALPFKPSFASEKSAVPGRRDREEF